MILAFDCFDRAIMNAGAAVDLVVRGQHFRPFSALGEWHLIVGPGLAGEVHDGDHLLAILADTHEAERVVVGVIAGEPLEACGIEASARPDDRAIQGHPSRWSRRGPTRHTGRFHCP